MTLKTYICSVFAAAALLVPTACVESDEQPHWDNRFSPEGEAFMNIAISIPNDAPVTRAESQTFDDGTEKEYEVKNVSIIIFGCKYTDPQTPEYMKYRAYERVEEKVEGKDFDSDDSRPNPNDNRITLMRSKTFKINKSNIKDDERLYVYALVNASKPDETNNKLTFSDGVKTSTTLDESTTFAKFMDMRFTYIGNFSDGSNMVMTNAPMANRSRNNYNKDAIEITYLPEIQYNNIYPTEAEAKANPAIDINVERLAVKLTVEADKSTESRMDGKLTASNAGVVSYDTDNIRWVTDNRNKECYNVRHVSTDYLGYKASSSSVLRFLDDQPTTAGQYRIFWAEDINYNYTTTKGAELEGYQAGPNIPNLNTQFDGELGGNLYTFENTSNEKGLLQGRTTRLLIRVPFFVGEDDSGNNITEPFYTISTDKSDKIYLLDGDYVQYDNNTKKFNKITGESSKSKVKNEKKKGHTIEEKILEHVSQLKIYQDWLDGTSAETKAKKIEEILTVTMLNGHVGQSSGLTNFPAFGKAKALISVNSGVAEADKTKFNEDFVSAGDAKIVAGDYTDSENKLTKQVNNDMKFNYYDEGYAYYKVLVRHFDDTEVDKYKDNNGGAYENVYPESDPEGDRAKNYLGRYGLVRNTWYTITLTGIRHIGYSNGVDTPYDTPDDEVDGYLSVRMLVNRWAHRTQPTYL